MPRSASSKHLSYYKEVCWIMLSILMILCEVKRQITQLDMTVLFSIKTRRIRIKMHLLSFRKASIQWNKPTQGLLSSEEAFNQALNVLFNRKNLINLLDKIDSCETSMWRKIQQLNNVEDILMRYTNEYLYTDNEQDHLLTMELVFTALQESNAELNPIKCKLSPSEVTVLDFFSTQTTQRLVQNV